MGVVPAQIVDQQPNWVFSLDADDFSLSSRIADGLFVYMGTHGMSHAEYADIILPVAHTYEKTGSYINMLGNCQEISFITQPPAKDIRTEWSWFAALDKTFNNVFMKNSLQIKVRQKAILNHLKHFGKLDFKIFLKQNMVMNFIQLTKQLDIYKNNKEFVMMPPQFSNFFKVSTLATSRLVDTFYFTHNTVRASHVMALTLNRFKSLKKNF